MKLYKVEITDYPASAAAHYAEVDALYERMQHGLPVDTDDITEWAPDGWLANAEQRAAWIERHGTTDFFWPSTKRLYRSRSGAQDRATLIESYGATAVVVESEEIIWLTPEIRRARRIDALEAELATLRAIPHHDEEVDR